eukprot:COSAG01_NODE_10305_length_2197_cov_2.491897_1_plen_198_part_00
MSGGGCQNRRHSLVHRDHGDSIPRLNRRRRRSLTSSCKALVSATWAFSAPSSSLFQPVPGLGGGGGAFSLRCHFTSLCVCGGGGGRERRTAAGLRARGGALRTGGAWPLQQTEQARTAISGRSATGHALRISLSKHKTNQPNCMGTAPGSSIIIGGVEPIKRGSGCGCRRGCGHGRRAAAPARCCRSAATPRSGGRV